MKISAKSDYACRSLLELSLHWPSDVPLQVNEIAERQSIPIKFLIHILISLKQAGFVKSTRGKRGGYILAKPPTEIRLNDIWKRLEGENISSGGVLKKRGHPDVLAGVWDEVENGISSIMRGITFEDICNRARANNKNFSYEI